METLDCPDFPGYEISDFVSRAFDSGLYIFQSENRRKDGGMIGDTHGIAKIVKFLVAVGLIRGGGGMVFSGLKSWSEGDSSTQWPVVKGEIRSTAIIPKEHRRRMRYHIRILYM